MGIALKTPRLDVESRGGIFGLGPSSSRKCNNLLRPCLAAEEDSLTDDAAPEETEIIDLASTLATICGTLSDAGRNAEYSGKRHAPLRCRPVTIKRAFMNLVGNAVKYGVRASVVLCFGDGRIRVDIHDEGPGIPAAEMERVFNPFYRVEPSRNRETGGFGLGLTIARGAIRAHGGDI